LGCLCALSAQTPQNPVFKTEPVKYIGNGRVEIDGVIYQRVASRLEMDRMAAMAKTNKVIATPVPSSAYHQFVSGSCLSGNSIETIGLYTIISASAKSSKGYTGSVYFGTADESVFSGNPTQVTVKDAQNADVIATGTYSPSSSIKSGPVAAIAHWNLSAGKISLQIVSAKGTMKVLENVPVGPIQWGQLMVYK